LQIEIFSKIARMGSTMMVEPRFDTISENVYVICVLGSVNPVNAGGLISGRPDGTGPEKNEAKNEQ
jgi:hypothetical protein